MTPGFSRRVGFFQAVPDLARGGTWLMASQFLVQAIYALQLMFLARMFGPDLFGQYALISATIGAVGAVGEISLMGALTRAAAISESRPATLALGMMVAALAALLAVALGSLAIVAVGGSWLATGPAIVALVASAIRCPLSTAIGYLRGSQRFPVVGWIELLGATITVLAAVWLVIFGWGLAGAFAGSAVGALCALAVALLSVYSEARQLPRSAITRPALLAIVRDLIGFTVRATLATAYRSSGVVIIAMLVGAPAAGVYRAALRLYELVALVPTSLAAVLVPTFARLQLVTMRSELSRLFQRSTVALTIAAVPLGLAMAAYAGPVLSLLFGDEFAVGDEVLAIFALAVILVAVRGPASELAYAGPRQRLATLVAAATVTANLILNLALVPRLGLSGAAWATVLAELMALGLFGIMAKPHLSRSGLVRDLAVVGLAGALAGGVMLVGTASWPWLALLAIPIYAAIVSRGIPWLAEVIQPVVKQSQNTPDTHSSFVRG
jgi:O-antigen/teichoic acid export membrane protein